MSQNSFTHADGNTPATPLLFGLNGELILVRIAVDPRQLEDLLDSLANLDFPVNPSLFHKPGSVIVEFPAYAGHVAQVKSALQSNGFDPDSVDVYGMLAAAATH